MVRRYYEEEMRYLQEAGKVFAETHPEIARYLNADSLTDRDPYVERLFEGFAFLAGRIHERLDDEMPEYTEMLTQLLYPHFLKPIPSLSVVEMKPKAGMVQKTTILEPGTEVRSAPVGDEHAVCRFTTTQPVRIQPIQLTGATLNWSPSHTSSVSLRFDLDRGINFADLKLSPLRLYFHADATIASIMHLFFTRHVARVSLKTGQGDTATLYGQQWVRPAGFGADEGIVPYGPYAMTGFRLLQEYLCFRRKFFFVDLFGFEQLGSADGASRFEVEVQFDRSYPEDKRFKAENLRLHCAPVVNLFTAESEPISVDGLSWEHRVVPSARHRRSIEAYDVTEVASIEDATGKRHSYQPFFEFKHPAKGKNARHFTARRRSGPSARPDIYLTLGGLGQEDLVKANTETLSVKLRCTNGSLPREKLREGMINQLAPDVPQIVQPVNLTQPSLILYPPTKRHEEFYWKLISHWSFNYLSVATVEALTGLLDLYDWTEGDANRRRLAGILDVRWAPKETTKRGAVLRGMEVVVTVKDGHFTDEGDLNLFGIVLSEFLAMYATINSFVHLAIEVSPSGKRYEWQPKQGAMPVI